VGTREKEESEPVVKEFGKGEAGDTDTEEGNEQPWEQRLEARGRFPCSSSSVNTRRGTERFGRLALALLMRS
jgi:hypothetical protein